ncbi:MAG: zinc ribbon domain-containing protein, partial [Gemmatimonadota bacterium]
CGAALTKALLCPDCSHENPPDSQFCTKCGTALSNGKTPKAEEPAEPTAAEEPAEPDAAEARVVRVYRYAWVGSGKEGHISVTVEDSNGNRLHQYAQKGGLTIRYVRSGPFVEKTLGETYADVGNGKQVVVNTEASWQTYIDRDRHTRPVRKDTYSPETRTIITSASFVALEYDGLEEKKWANYVLYSKLPCKVYRYDGRELKEIKDVPQHEWGAELACAQVLQVAIVRELISSITDTVNVIFAEDFKSIKAVLPRVKLRDRISHNSFDIVEVGFTLVTVDGKERLLPYIMEVPTGKWSLDGAQTVVYSRVPEEFQKTFARLKREGGKRWLPSTS